MPFDSSLPDEVAPDEATALRCKWTTEDGTRCLRAYDHPGMHRTPPAWHSVPADAETAGEPERPDLDCVRPTGCRDLLKRGCAHGCAEAADELTRLGEEMAPEAPECTCQSGTWDKFDSPKDCLVHGSAVAQPPRRPPYAVAYVLEDGTQYEVALPGDATVRAVDGALVITHDKPVLAMGQVRPMEGA